MIVSFDILNRPINFTTSLLFYACFLLATDVKNNRQFKKNVKILILCQKLPSTNLSKPKLEPHHNGRGVAEPEKVDQAFGDEEKNEETISGNNSQIQNLRRDER